MGPLFTRPSLQGTLQRPGASGGANWGGAAFDKATGAEIWRGGTPFPTNGNPVTYRTRSGRQFVVIATG